MQLCSTCWDKQITISAFVLSPTPLSPLLLVPFFIFRLRALSSGGGGGSGGERTSIVASPPLSPALPKYKLADYRYGREEMLALYVKENKVGNVNVMRVHSI